MSKVALPAAVELVRNGKDFVGNNLRRNDVHGNGAGKRPLRGELIRGWIQQVGRSLQIEKDMN